MTKTCTKRCSSLMGRISQEECGLALDMNEELASADVARRLVALKID